MKKLSFQVAFQVLCLVGLMSCKEDVVDPYPPTIDTDMYHCHFEKTWDETGIRDVLVGEWLWEYRSCASVSGHTASYVDSLEMVFEFNSDSTLTILEHGQIIQTATWEIPYNGDANYFYMNVEPWVSQLDGTIFICDDRVEFYAAPVDGCNNFLKRR